MEIWKDIPGFDGYKISNFGNIKSCLTNKGKTKNWKIRTPVKTPHGYKRIILRKNKNPYNWLVHRIVLLAFVGPDKRQVNHKNFIRDDNKLINLEYVTSSENEIYSYKHGRKSRAGNNSFVRKIDEKTSIKIRCESGLLKNIAKKYKLSMGQISNIKNKKSWANT